MICQGSTWRPTWFTPTRSKPFASLPSALLVGSLGEPGARWCSLQAGAAISLPVSALAQWLAAVTRTGHSWWMYAGSHLVEPLLIAKSRKAPPLALGLCKIIQSHKQGQVFQYSYWIDSKGRIPHRSSTGGEAIRPVFWQQRQLPSFWRSCLPDQRVGGPSGADRNQGRRGRGHSESS